VTRAGTGTGADGGLEMQEGRDRGRRESGEWPPPPVYESGGRENENDPSGSGLGLLRGSGRESEESDSSIAERDQVEREGRVEGGGG
jgi:hypothetical protein